MFENYYKERKWKYLIPIYGLIQIKNSQLTEKHKWYIFNLIIMFIMILIFNSRPKENIGEDRKKENSQSSAVLNKGATLEKVETCKLEIKKISEDLTGSQKKKLFRVIGMNFKEPLCDQELKKFGVKESYATVGESIIINYTIENVSHYDFKNQKDNNVFKIFARYKSLPAGNDFERDPYATGRYYKD